MPLFRWFLLMSPAWSWLQPITLAVDTPDTAFDQEIASLLVRRCLECHQASEASGSLNLTSHEGILQGGDSGPALVPGNAAGSLIIERILNGEMPPPRQGIPQKLPDEEINTIRKWINGGACWPPNRTLELYERSSDVRAGRDWWSLQPLLSVRPPLPELQHPIDAFVRQRLTDAGLTPAPSASPREQIRRLYFDLTGLSPSADEIEHFERDPSDQAYGLLVDDLLSRPQFGERWARHWLDVARFAETSGYERDQPKPFAWKYRDWVVNAWNRDLPYDQFIRAQLAGDELPDRDEQSTIATGFLRLGTWNDEPNDPEDYLYERLEDLVHATSTAFLGLTVKCARCHDHKFDPIAQMDYYRMAAVFRPGPVAARDRGLLGGPDADELGYAEVLGWTDISRTPVPLFLLKNGERHHPLQQAVPGGLSGSGGRAAEFRPNPDPRGRTTGLRLQLANWIVSDQQPLTSRVIVNRLWLHHFGEGLVRTPDNFGFTGDLPTHPELLDWLAAELLRNDWKLKPLHRLMVTSSVYRQSSLHPDESLYHQQDAGNKLLWKASRRRLDAETLRDAILEAAGDLDMAIGGPGFLPTLSADALEGLSRKAAAWEASPREQQRRRSLYLFTQRSLLPPLMTAFDFCDTTQPCGQRSVTIVAPQALALLNNEFIHECTESLATRLLLYPSGERIQWAWRAVLKRNPTAEEIQLAEQHVLRQLRRFRQAEGASSHLSSSDTSAELRAWASLCLVLLNSNEFAWVD